MKQLLIIYQEKVKIKTLTFLFCCYLVTLLLSYYCDGVHHQVILGYLFDIINYASFFIIFIMSIMLLIKTICHKSIERQKKIFILLYITIIWLFLIYMPGRIGYNFLLLFDI